MQMVNRVAGERVVRGCMMTTEDRPKGAAQRIIEDRSEWAAACTLTTEGRVELGRGSKLTRQGRLQGSGSKLTKEGRREGAGRS